MDTDALEEKFDAEVTVERAPDARGREGTVRFTVRCDADATEQVRERITELEADVAFETTR